MGVKLENILFFLYLIIILLSYEYLPYVFPFICISHNFSSSSNSKDTQFEYLIEMKNAKECSFLVENINAIDSPKIKF